MLQLERQAQERKEREDEKHREREEHLRQKGTQKNLRKQQKILRDHCLVMGNIDS